MWNHEQSSNQKRNGGGSVKVAPVRKRIIGGLRNRLQWYGDVKSRKEGHVLRRIVYCTPVSIKRHVKT